ncbi:hypothetical protein [Methanobrevibacter sp.]
MNHNSLTRQGDKTGDGSMSRSKKSKSFKVHRGRFRVLILS